MKKLNNFIQDKIGLNQHYFNKEFDPLNDYNQAMKCLQHYLIKNTYNDHMGYDISYEPWDGYHRGRKLEVAIIEKNQDFPEKEWARVHVECNLDEYNQKLPTLIMMAILDAENETKLKEKLNSKI